jgi:hypothetical protein
MRYCAMSSRFSPGKQREVVVLPEHGQDLLAALAAVDLEPDEERERLAGFSTITFVIP